MRLELSGKQITRSRKGTTGSLTVVVGLTREADCLNRLVDIGSKIPGNPARVGRKRLNLMQDAPRVGTEPDQCLKQFANSTRTRRRDCIVTIALERKRL